MTHNFGRFPRREIAMSHPVPAAPVENNYRQRLRFVCAIRRLHRPLDRCQTVGKTPVFREFRQLRSEAVHKPQLYPIRSEIAAHCDPSL